jgi:hypothetical protein
MFALRIAALAFLTCFTLPAAGYQIRGTIVDNAGAGAGGASVQIIDAKFQAVARATADATGTFSLDIPASGSFVLRVWLQGFRSRRLPVIVQDEITDLGKISLDFGGCDQPGVICDWFGVQPHDPMLSRGYLRIPVNCVAALAVSTAFCAGDSDWKRGQAKADVRLEKNGPGVYLAAINGAALSTVNPSTADCHDVHPSEAKVRINGLGRGDEICVYTHDRKSSHVFFTEEVALGSKEVLIWQITRPGNAR